MGHGSYDRSGGSFPMGHGAYDSIYNIHSPWVMEHTTDHFLMGHGAYDRSSLHGSWSIRQTISPWVMEHTLDHLSMGHGCMTASTIFTPHGLYNNSGIVSVQFIYFGHSHFHDCQGRLSSHLQTSAVTDVRTPPHRLLTWHRSRPKGTKGLPEGSGVRVRVQWN